MPTFRRPVRIRWWIFAFTLAFPMLSYIQRLGVQDLAGTVMPALHLSQLQIGWLATAFTTAYALAQLPGGIFCQRVPSPVPLPANADVQQPRPSVIAGGLISPPVAAWIGERCKATRPFGARAGSVVVQSRRCPVSSRNTQLRRGKPERPPPPIRGGPDVSRRAARSR